MKTHKPSMISKGIQTGAMLFALVAGALAFGGCGSGGGGGGGSTSTGGTSGGGSGGTTGSSVRITSSRVLPQTGSNDTTNVYSGDTISFYASCDPNTATTSSNGWYRNGEYISSSRTSTFSIPSSFAEYTSRLNVDACCNLGVSQSCLRTLDNKLVHPGPEHARDFTASYLAGTKGFSITEMDMNFSSPGYEFFVPSDNANILCTDTGEYTDDTCFMFGKHKDDTVTDSYILDNLDSNFNGEAHTFAQIEDKSRELWDSSDPGYMGDVSQKLCLIELQYITSLSALYTSVDSCLR